MTLDGFPAMQIAHAHTPLAAPDFLPAIEA
jgi:hypothetical protein